MKRSFLLGFVVEKVICCVVLSLFFCIFFPLKEIKTGKTDIMFWNRENCCKY